MAESLPDRPTTGFACPPPPAPRIPPGAEIHPGFGVVALCRDGVEVVRDVHGEHVIDHYTRHIDNWSRAGHAPIVWTLHIDGPLSSQVYAFTSDREWTLIERGNGFA